MFVVVYSVTGQGNLPTWQGDEAEAPECFRPALAADAGRRVVLNATHYAERVFEPGDLVHYVSRNSHYRGMVATVLEPECEAGVLVCFDMPPRAGLPTTIDAHPDNLERVTL